MSFFYRITRRTKSFFVAFLFLLSLFYPFYDLIPVAYAQFDNPNFASNNSGWSVSAIIPDGWVLAPGNTNYSTDDFLVMQYEAKAWDTLNDEVVATGGSSNSWAGSSGQTQYRAISVPEGLPWRYIQRSTTNYSAIEACSDATQLSGLASGSTHLITNNEWMTLARNIEQQTANWADGVIGSTVSSSGGLKRGNAGTNDSVSYNGADPEGGTGRNTKAMHQLSNGNQIWDLSGNVFEWTNNTISRQHHPVAWNGTTEIAGFGYSDYSVGSLARYIQTWKAGGLQYADVGPSNTSLNANHGVGIIYHYSGSTDTNLTSYGFIRGGNWNSTLYPGLFTLFLNYASSETRDFIGFRCATNPLEIEQSFSAGTGQGGGNANGFSVSNVAQGKIYQSLNLGGSLDYKISAFVYNNNSGNEGNAINSGIANIYVDGSALPTSYEPVGGGWYKLSAQGVGTNTNREYGLIVEPGNTILIDSIDMSAVSNIDSTYKYAWGENTGWINFGSVGGNAAVTSHYLTGYAWGENIGWISLNCENEDSCGTNNYFVENDGNGDLSGYAWGENIGWLSFSCENTSSCGSNNYGVTIDWESGEFFGYAWSENAGWVSFNCANDSSCATNDYKVKTTWRPEPTLSFEINANSCDLGLINPMTTGTCTFTMTAATNADDGYTISYVATDTLTHEDDIHTINATGETGASSEEGTSQFGCNLANNNDLGIGANPSGGNGDALINYNTPNVFSFLTNGAAVAGSAGPSEPTTYTVSCIANMHPGTEMGNYSTTLTYTILPSFY